MSEELELFPCECGCGELTPLGTPYIRGHDEIYSHYRHWVVERRLKPKRYMKMFTNKDSPQYLGIVIGEQVLSNVFKDVKRMAYGNPGYDFVCEEEYKIDVKTSATGYKGHWYFTINKNKIADYFLCLAFESRNDLSNPVHLWLIPGNVINHLKSLTLQKSIKILAKWSKYEQSIDKVRKCCNEMEMVR